MENLVKLEIRLHLKHNAWQGYTMQIIKFRGTKNTNSIIPFIRKNN